MQTSEAQGNDLAGRKKQFKKVFGLDHILNEIIEG